MLGKITCRLEKPAVKGSKDYWDSWTWNFSNKAEIQREDTLRARHEGRSVRNEAGIQARWDTYRNNNRIRDRYLYQRLCPKIWSCLHQNQILRISEIDNWRVALEQTVTALDAELRKIDVAKQAVEQAVETKVIDLDTVNEIMSVREQRRDVDFIEDEAQIELAKETCLLKETRNLLEKKGQEAWHQIARLKEVRQFIIRDLHEKIESLEIDRYVLGLNEKSPGISFRPDPLRLPKGMMTLQAWEEQSRYNKIRADAELASSVKIRESILITIDQTYNDLRAQREVTDFFLRKRLFEYQKVQNDLFHQKEKILPELCKVEQEIKNAEDAVWEKTDKIKLAETRLEHRSYRYGGELTRDDAHYGLTQEVLQLRATQNILQEKVDDLKKALNMLQCFLQEIESQIEFKQESRIIEQQALDIRNRIRASHSTPLTQTDRNIALSATVTVPEDRGKRIQNGEIGRICVN